MSLRNRILIVSLAIAVMVIVPASATAQTSPMSFGVKAGINSATLSSDDDDERLERLMGAVAGVFVGRNLNSNVRLQVEGLFSMRGAKADQADAKIMLNYIDVPVLLQFGRESANGVRFFGFTGPQGSFNLKAEVEAGETSPAARTTEDVSDDTESFDFGWTIGAGMEARRITVDARYTLGLMNIDRHGDLNGGRTVKNRTISVMVGIRLR